MKRKTVIISLAALLLFSIILIPAPPILVPSTLISLTGVLITAWAIVTGKMQLCSDITLGYLLYFVISFILFGKQTADLANYGQTPTHSHLMMQIYLRQIYTSPDNRESRAFGSNKYDLHGNHAIIPESIKGFQNDSEAPCCKQYYFSLFHRKKYFVINQYIAGKKLHEFAGNAGNIVCITEADTPGSQVRLTAGEFGHSLVPFHAPLMLDGTFYKLDQ